ncbi:ABC transporter ATP-binding protein [Mangrovicoccus sp. HB161399]|uniref:ABC transporter ATP-binding protein n=1 Tax=Mangrovicoccus sp. HB161399 TaxID=2720392 RepID=UPI00155569CC|nr:ABC transporter ATP-binding protein [Mangrovicoccus sp. HB161399]
MTLSMTNVTAGYGDRMILNGLDLDIAPGQRISLIGHNGAGKSTILKAITGQIPVKGGEIRFDGAPMKGLAPEARVRHGIVQVPAGRHVFPQLSVEKNLRVGAFTRSDRAEIERDLDRYMEKFPVLRAKARRPAGTLSGGEQQLLAVARALMGRPRLLLVDEPSLGLSPVMVDEVFSYLGSLTGVSVVLAEQNVRMALKVTEEAVVLSQGAIQHRMGADRLMQDAEFRRSYLGG